MDSEKLDQLICEARERFHTVRATITQYGDQRVRAEASRRFQASSIHEEIFGRSESEELDREASVPLEYDHFGRTIRVWWEKPYRVRQEIDLPDGSGTEYKVVDDEAMWAYGPGHELEHFFHEGVKPGILEFEVKAMLDPSGGSGLDILMRYDLQSEIVDKTWHAGRETLRVEAKAKGDLDFLPEPLWWGAEYEFLVDSERGVILRMANKLDGKEFDVLEFLEVSFDEALPDSVFRLNQA